jgi:hypothetical protein
VLPRFTAGSDRLSAREIDPEYARGVAGCGRGGRGAGSGAGSGVGGSGSDGDIGFGTTFGPSEVGIDWPDAPVLSLLPSNFRAPKSRRTGKDVKTSDV